MALVYFLVNSFTAVRRRRMRHSLPTIVFPAQAGIQRSVNWIPAFAGMTDRVSSHLRDTRLVQFLAANRDEILRICARHGARKVHIFGSAARGEAGSDSDVDFLVEMESGRSLLDPGRLLMDLQDLLVRQVDVVEREGLRWYLGDRVLKEAVHL